MLHTNVFNSKIQTPRKLQGLLLCCVVILNENNIYILYVYETRKKRIRVRKFFR